MKKTELLVLAHSLGKPGFLDHEGLENSSFLASFRLQLIPAVKAARSLGWETRVGAFRSEEPVLLEKLGKPSVCLIGKLSHPDQEALRRMALANVAIATRAKRLGANICIIYSDNLLAGTTATRLELTKDLLHLADTVVFPCKGMRDISADVCEGKRVEVVEDPWQVEKANPRRLESLDPVGLLWFGHCSNAIHLISILPAIKSAMEGLNRSFRLEILTDTGTCKELLRHASGIFGTSSVDVEIRGYPWNPNNQPTQLEECLRRAHICLLPTDPKDPRKAGASHNRAVDAIQSGAVGIGSGIKSYRELETCMLVGDNFENMITQAVIDYERISNQIVALRETLLSRFDPDINCSKWKTLLRQLAKAQ